MATFKVICI